MNLTAIIIIAIVCGTIMGLVNIFSENNKLNKSTQEKFKKYESNIEEKLQNMQARIEVLEKIVTDENYSLKKEFSDL